MNLLICGSSGRMGTVVRKEALSLGHSIVCGVDENPTIETFPVYRTFREVIETPEVVIDFSSARNLEERLSFCMEKKIGIVIASTGFSPAQTALIEQTSKQIPIFQSANFSIGIYLLHQFAKQAAIAWKESDIEIVEKHHAGKKDAPSGTALSLAGTVRSIRGGSFVSERSKARILGEIGIHSVRGGSLIGEHDIYFLGDEETLTLSHCAQSRDIFAKGAIRAAKWLLARSPGLYSMEDLLSKNAGSD